MQFKNRAPNFKFAYKRGYTPEEFAAHLVHLLHPAIIAGPKGLRGEQ